MPQLEIRPNQPVVSGFRGEDLNVKSLWLMTDD
jgi:hypothetical protein